VFLTVDAAIAHHRKRSTLSIMVLAASSNRLEALRYLIHSFESAGGRAGRLTRPARGE